MSVTFRVRGVQQSVEMSNATARVVLSMLDATHPEGYLEGRLSLVVAAHRLALIEEKTIVARAIAPRRLGPRHVDNGVPLDWLRSRIDGLRALVMDAARVRATHLEWS